jgi:hypothetical protein
MKLSTFLNDIGKPIAYYPSLAKLIGVKQAVFLCQILFWTDKGKDGWIYRSVDQITDETGLSYKEQIRVRSNLVSVGLMKETYDRSNHRLLICPNMDKLDEVWSGKIEVLYPPSKGRHMTNGHMPNGQMAYDQRSDGICPKVRCPPSPHIYSTESTTESTTETAQVPSPSNPEKKEPKPVLGQVVVDEWNKHQELPRIRLLSDGRKKHLSARMKDTDFVENWLVALDKILQSDFCMGKNRQSWKADFDWFLKPDTMTKILEGKYDNRESQMALPT